MPYFDVTVTDPEVALAPTVTVRCVGVAETTMAFFPPTTTFFGVDSPEPEITSVPPRVVVVGLKEVTVGATWNAVAETAVPRVEATVTVPSTAPVGTVAVTAPGVSVTIVPATPPKRTEVAVPRLEPEIVTVDPATAAAGEMELIDGV